MLIFSTPGARGSNEFHYLYLVDTKINTLKRVHGFENIVNTSYDEKQRVVIAYCYSGTNNYSIYKILPTHMVVQIGESFEDDFESDADELERRFEKILQKNKH